MIKCSETCLELFLGIPDIRDHTFIPVRMRVLSYIKTQPRLRIISSPNVSLNSKLNLDFRERASHLGVLWWQHSLGFFK